MLVLSSKPPLRDDAPPMKTAFYLGLIFLAVLGEGRTSRNRRRVIQRQDPSSTTDSPLKERRLQSGRFVYHELYPTAARAELDRLRRRRLSADNVTENSPVKVDYPKSWFYKEQNAVYAAIPDQLDPDHVHNRRLQHFYAMRHLSRYEVMYRKQNNISLERGWTGTYDHLFSNESHVEHEHHRSRMQEIISSSAAGPRGLSYLEERTEPTMKLEFDQDSSAMTTNSATTTSIGGVFDNYQSVPLSQGYGTHYANIWVGSPTPQRKTVIVDTGSHYTAFPCSGCVNWCVNESAHSWV